MIHLYALTAEPVALGGLRGVGGAAVRLVDCGSLCAVVSEHEQAPPALTGHALAHAAVVAAVARTVPTLPVRFGSRHGDEQTLRGRIGQRQGQLSAQLRRLGRHVEFAVRAAPEPEAQPSQARAGTGSGRAYLQRRLGQQQAARCAAEAARHRLRTRTAALGGLSVLTSERDGPRGPETAYLVEAEHAERFRALAAEAVAGDPCLLLAGPWPPYTFAAQPADGA
ncbi:MAG TPA: GvpL/GvpF family gas vesicle protein [Egibacteraceae bacterium]|nr:GvpL/GvpF family gas vesicle protein [Egibacteraceae bacterium]